MLAINIDKKAKILLHTFLRSGGKRRKGETKEEVERDGRREIEKEEKREKNRIKERKDYF